MTRSPPPSANRPSDLGADALPSNDAESDLATLLAAVSRGDRGAFTEVYGRTAAKLFAVVIRILGDRARAEDVLQEVYLRVWQSARSYSPEAGRPMTWLITIARNRAIDVARQRRETTIPELEDGRDWLELIEDPRDHGAEFTDLDRLRVCLGQLDDRQRRCLLDAYYMGYSRDELAARFGAPVNTVKTWLHRSTAALRDCLGEP